MPLSPEQLARAVKGMHEYLHAPPTSSGKTPAEESAEGDKERVALIEGELGQLVSAYLAGNVPLEDFKTRNDSVNKRHENWGFKGIKGQMFFNMVVNVAHDPAECDQEIKAAIAIPNNEDIARSRIRTFSSYVRRIGEAHIEAGGKKQGRPKPGSILFFLSYFWQIQDRRIWPVCYTNSVNVMTDLNLWQPTEDPAEDYITFKHLHEELAQAFTSASGRPFTLYDVEHVFWFKGGNPYGLVQQVVIQGNVATPSPTQPTQTTGVPSRHSLKKPRFSDLPGSHDRELSQLSLQKRGLSCAMVVSSPIHRKGFPREELYPRHPVVVCWFSLIWKNRLVELASKRSGHVFRV